MRKSSPSMQEWKNLYHTAMEFKKIESWKWMLDSDIFGVQNPVSGEIGYCCILGNLGEVFALVVYLGTEGLEGYLKMQSEEIASGKTEGLYFLKCLMASFEDRKLLERSDLEIIKKLGLKFRGKNAWPLFRSYQPGYYPWYLTREEVTYLTLVLQQTIEIALRFKKDKKMLTPPEKNRYLVRVPVRKGKALEWKDEWLKPSPLKKAEEGRPIDELRLKRIKKNASFKNRVWEVDFFYPPMVVKEGERPFYPCLFLWIDHHTGLILNHYMARPSEYTSKFPEQFLSFIENIKFIPKVILVKKEEIFRILTPISSRLKIKLKLVKKLEVLEEVQTAMLESFT